MTLQLLVTVSAARLSRAVSRPFECMITSGDSSLTYFNAECKKIKNISESKIVHHSEAEQQGWESCTSCEGLQEQSPYISCICGHLSIGDHSCVNRQHHQKLSRRVLACACCAVALRFSGVRRIGRHACQLPWSANRRFPRSVDISFVCGSKQRHQPGVSRPTQTAC